MIDILTQGCDDLIADANSPFMVWHCFRGSLAEFAFSAANMGERDGGLHLHSQTALQSSPQQAMSEMVCLHRSIENQFG